jgi:two-component system chemotaxis response regulator CheY
MPDRDKTNPKCRRILCVDDDGHVRTLLSYLLQRAGYACEGVADGREALQKISADMNGFELILTDNNLPGMDGIALVEALRVTGFRGRIVVFSSPLDETCRAAYTRHQVDGFIEKPVSADKLLQTITELVNSATPKSKCNN